MTGGILDLVAKGIEDIYLTGAPDITFFKTVYRRHTNFSIGEQDLHFTNKLDFDKEGYCRIEHYGDLLYRLYLVVKLPKIDLKYKTLTMKEVKNLLKKYDIIWNPKNDLGEKFNEIAFMDIKILIEHKKKNLGNELYVFEQILDMLKGSGKFVPKIWKHNYLQNDNNGYPNENELIMLKKYFNELIIDFLKYSEYHFLYKIIDSQKKDILENQLPIANSVMIQNLLFNTILDYSIGNDRYQSLLPISYINTNLEFYFNVNSLNFNIENNIETFDSNIFRSEISNIYNLSPYEHLDAYKIFDNILFANKNEIKYNSDVQNMKLSLVNNIRIGLIKNIKLIKQIFCSLNNDCRFIFYKKIPVDINPCNYKTNSSFINLSLQPNSLHCLNDFFTLNFNLIPESSESTNINYSFLNFVKKSINQFHFQNKKLFEKSHFSDYFNDKELWFNIKVLTNDFPTNSISCKFKNVYFLNYLWINMNIDIRKSIKIYLISRNYLGLNLSTVNQLNEYLKKIQNDISIIIKSKILSLTNYDIIKTLNSIERNKDILMCGIIRPGLINSIIDDSKYGKITIPEFILLKYLNSLDDFEKDLFDNQLEIFINLKNKLINIIKLYNTNISSIPTYITYLNQNKNIYLNDETHINNLSHNKKVFSDVQCSIWNWLFNQFIENYNNLYNKFLLGLQYYQNNLGIEATQYLIQIFLMMNNSINSNSHFDYFRKIDEFEIFRPKIIDFFQIKLSSLLEQFSQLDNNENLLKIRNFSLPKSKFYFEKFNIIVDYLLNLIFEENDSTYDLETSLRLEFLNKKNELIEPRNNAMDIIKKINDVIIYFLENINNLNFENPYFVNRDIHKYNLWIELRNKLNNYNELYKFNDLFNWLYSENGSEELFKFKSQIDILYNGFISEIDIYNFIQDYIIQKTIFKDLPGLIGQTIKDTYTNILKYYQTKQHYTKNLLEKINGNSKGISLHKILERSMNYGLPAKFAWIKKIGHYLIDKVWIKLDDQLIDKQYGEWIDIWHSLTKINNKEKGYRKLIGDVKKLYTFNNKQKQEYELIIPLQFWFCRNIGASLPLIALNNTEVRIYVKLKNFNDVSFYEPFTIFKKKPKLHCHILSEYIYIEDEERQKLATSKLEYLIDVLQFNGDILVSKYNFEKDNLLKTTTRFKNSCKELFWVLQNKAYIDGSLENGEKKWNLYSYDLEECINPMKVFKIKFNDRYREKFKDDIFYNYAQPYERHNSDPSTGVNIYSFAFDPESLIPSGAVNMSRIDDIDMLMYLKPFVVKDIIINNTVYRWAIYALTINILRIFSGFAGLVFVT